MAVVGRVVFFCGSRNDLPLIRESGIFDILDAVVGHRPAWCPDIISADRHHPQLEKRCQVHFDSGVRVYIGFAGKAAVLPGSIASILGFQCPVIGVAGDREGLEPVIDKPNGCPVICAGFGKSGLYNAGLIAAQIVALQDPEVAKRLVDFLALQSTKKQPEYDVVVKGETE